MRCVKTCRQLAGQVEAILHLATLGAGHPEVGSNDLEIGQNLIEIATQQNLDRFLFFSTINVYGQGHWKISQEIVEPANLPIDHTTPCFPDAPYSRSNFMLGCSIQVSVST